MKTIKYTVTISKNSTIYIPPVIRGALNLKRNDKISLEVVDGAIIIKPYFDIVAWADHYLYAHNFKSFYKVGRDRVTGITTVILPDGKIGVAQCSPNDTFNDEVGEAIALARALEEDDKIPKEVFG